MLNFSNKANSQEEAPNTFENSAEEQQRASNVDVITQIELSQRLDCLRDRVKNKK